MPDPDFRTAGFGLGGWRQSRHLRRQVKRPFDKIRNSRRQRRHPDRVCAYLGLCRSLVARAERLRRELEAAGAETWDIDAVQDLMDHALRQIDQVDRRLLQGEAIPHEEKVFSIFEPHTRWCAKGKAGRMVEPRHSHETGHQPLIHGASGRIPRRAPGPETSRRVQNPLFWHGHYIIPKF